VLEVPKSILNIRFAALYNESCMCLDFLISLEILRCCIGVKPEYFIGKIFTVSVVYRDKDSLSRKVKFSGFLLLMCLISSVLIDL
jgi:hypothetical protein